MKKLSTPIFSVFLLLLLSLVTSACGLTIAPEVDQVATVVAATIEAGQNATAVVVQVSTEVAATIHSENATRTAEEGAMLTATAAAFSPTATPIPPSAVQPTAVQPTAVQPILVVPATQPPPVTDPPPMPTNTPPPPTAPPPTNTPVPTNTPMPTNTPFPTPKPPVEEIFTVAEANSIVSTNLYIQTGDIVTFSASGEIWGGVLFTGTNGPNGWDNTDCDPKFPLPCAHPFSLLAKVDGGNWFEVGQSYQYTFLGSGFKSIFLRINDDAPGNGSGSFNVTVRITSG